MRLIVSAMHRSGINAISKWLLRQSSLKNKELKTVYGDWVETPNWTLYEYEKDLPAFVSQINHPNHRKELWKKFVSNSTVMTIERERIQVVDKLCQSHTFGYNYVNKDNSWQQIIIIRSFKNWLASVAKAHLTVLNNDPQNPILHCYNVHQDIEKYRTYLDLATDTTIHCFEGPWFDPMVIVYDKWVQDKQYRKKIVADLDLPKFTDAGFKDVPQNCGGSSFDGLEFNGKADEMKVLERWKEYENDEGFIKVLDDYSDIVRMSDQVCGE